MKKVFLSVPLVLVSLLILPFIVSYFMPWTPIHCCHEDIDIQTGKMRRTQFYWFLCVGERIEDTPLSTILEGEQVGDVGADPWRRVNTFSRPAVYHSPHYLFHGALSQSEQFPKLAEMLDVPLQQRKDMARMILLAWQHAGSDRGADECFEQWMQQENALTDEQGATSVR